MYPAKTEPMIKNTQSSIGCSGMANKGDYHGLEMFKNHAKDSTTERCLQPDPTNMECMWPNQSLKSQGNAPIECRQKRMMGHSRSRRRSRSYRPAARPEGGREAEVKFMLVSEWQRRSGEVRFRNNAAGVSCLGLLAEGWVHGLPSKFPCNNGFCRNQMDGLGELALTVRGGAAQVA